MRRPDPADGAPAADAAGPATVEELRAFLREGLSGRRQEPPAASPTAPVPAASSAGASAPSGEADDLLRLRAEHVLRSAAEQARLLLDETRFANERRWAEARSHASEIRLVAEAAAQRGLASAQEVNAQSLETAERRARELVESARGWVEQVLTGTSAMPMSIREMVGSLGDVPREADDPARPPDGPLTPPPASGESAVRSGPPQPVAPTVAAEDLPQPVDPTVAAEDSRPVPPVAAAGPVAAPAMAEVRAFAAMPALGAVELIVGSFARFSELAAFTRALRAVPGVESIDTRRFYKGVVTLRLRYDGDVPLDARLRELREFAPEVLSASAGRIELRVKLAEQGVDDGSAPA